MPVRVGTESAPCSPAVIPAGSATAGFTTVNSGWRARNAAFVGHRVEVKTDGKKDEKKTVLYTAPKAYNSFLYNLRKLYPKKEGGTA